MTDRTAITLELSSEFADELTELGRRSGLDRRQVVAAALQEWCERARKAKRRDDLEAEERLEIARMRIDFSDVEF